MILAPVANHVGSARWRTSVIGDAFNSGAPGTVANLAMWFDASRITPVADGTAVSSWTDLAGSNHAVQGTGSKQPLYKVNIQNGRPGVLFDNTDDNLQTGNLTVNIPGITIFAIAKSGTNGGIIVESGAVWTSNNGFVLSRDAADRAIVVMNGSVGASNANTSPTTISVPRMLSAVYDKSLSSGEVKIYVDGVDRTNTTADANNLDNILTVASPINLGSRNGGASGPLNGYLHEILIYLRALTTSERLNIESYLRAKWGTA